jgi:hypothetical protein
MDRFTTLFLYMCRLIYEEKREDAGIYKRVPSTTVEIVEKMRAYGLLEKGKTGKDVTKKERAEAQRTLAHFNIIHKRDTAPWDGDGNKILILPSILLSLANRSIDTVYADVEKLKANGGDSEPEQ